MNEASTRGLPTRERTGPPDSTQLERAIEFVHPTGIGFLYDHWHGYREVIWLLVAAGTVATISAFGGAPSGSSAEEWTTSDLASLEQPVRKRERGPHG